MSSINQDQVSFHDATLVDISQASTTVTLKLENIVVGEVQKAVELAIYGVETILRDDVLSSELRMEQATGEVLTLAREGDRIALVVEWNDYAARYPNQVVFEFRGPKVALQILQIGKDMPA